MSAYEERQKKVKPMDDQADFVCSFVDDSSEKRSPMEDIWDETEQNFLVRPLEDLSLSSSTRHPLYSTLGEVNMAKGRTLSILKDPETHQEVMTIVAKIVLVLFGEPGFVKARGVGFEDTYRAEAVGKLIEHVHRLPGHYQAFLEWIMSMGVYGTGILRSAWLYQEETRMQRIVQVDEMGMQLSSFSEVVRPVWDDPSIEHIGIRDFFPDPGYTATRLMNGCVERFKITAAEAYRRAAKGIYEYDAVKRACERAMDEDSKEAEQKPHTDPSQLLHRSASYHEFVPLVGYDYYGETPFRASKDGVKFDDGISRRVITVLAGETVRSKPWPRRIPFFDGRLIPRLGSFYGISPAEIIRYDQDFADTLKMMLADAVVRATHPPLIYDKDAELDLAKLRAYKPRIPIGARFRGQEPVQQLQYNPPVQPAFSMYTGVKQQMREASGALGSIQGIGLGINRASATEAQQTFQMAMDRPELFAKVIETEYLPPIGKYILELYQEFLPDGEDGALEIRKRIGESAFPVELLDILADFDIEFVGTRAEGGRQQKIAAFREIVQASANPVVAQLIPWIPLLRKWFDGIGAHDIAAMVGNPMLIQLNTLLTQIGGPNTMAGNGNGEMPDQQPVGMMPAQAEGQPL